MRTAASVAMCVIGLAGVVTGAQHVMTRVVQDTAVQSPVGGTFVAGSAGQADVGIIALDPVNLGPAVQNAPYSAEAVTEVTQVLADGNRIEQRTSALIARDSSGRTRREQNVIALGTFVAQNSHPIVTITDPTTGVHVTLNAEQKVAFRSKLLSAKALESELGARMELRRKMGVTMSSRSASGLPPGPKGGDPRLFEPPVFDVAVFEPSAAGMAIPPPPPPPPPPPFGGSFKTETLEPMDIEGLRAEGVRTTMTIPAGAMGNALPIDVVSEQWYSPELKIVLMTRRSDPRFGETVYRLTMIDRAEPGADLFKVPPDFRLEDMRRGAPLPLRPEGQ